MYKKNVKKFIVKALCANLLIFLCSLKSLAFPVSLSPKAWAHNFKISFAISMEKMPFLLILGFLASILLLKFYDKILPKMWKGNLKRNIVKVIAFTICFNIFSSTYLYILGAEFQMYILLSSAELGVLSSLVVQMTDVAFLSSATEN